MIILENSYSKEEYNNLLKIKNHWIDTPFRYDVVVDVIIDINLFKLSYETKFPESCQIINQNEHLIDRLNFSLSVFQRYVSKEKLVDNEFDLALNGIDLGFQSLFFEMKYGDLMKSGEVF